MKAVYGKCGQEYGGRLVENAIRCGEVLPCEKCGGPILPNVEDELPEAEIVEAL